MPPAALGQRCRARSCRVAGAVATAQDDAPVNIALLTGRAFLGRMGGATLLFGGKANIKQTEMRLGDITAVVSRTGALRLSGAVQGAAAFATAAREVAECVRLSGVPLAPGPPPPPRLDEIQLQCMLGRTVLLPKMAGLPGVSRFGRPCARSPAA